MKLLFITFTVLFTYMNAVNLGTIATGSKTGGYYKLGKDISMLLKEYDLDLEPITSGGSYQNLETLNGVFIKDNSTFFAIVQKDAISYYNYFQYKLYNKSIYSKIPVVVSLGIDQIHIFALEDSEFDFENRKTYKVHCGSEQSGSCITAKYIEKAYDYKFIYVNSKAENVVDKLKDGTIDIAFKVVASPANYFKDIRSIKFIDLPTNFIMEDMYVHSKITREDYPWINENIHAFAVPKVLITSLWQKEYDPIIANITKILISNKRYLEQRYGVEWKDVDFYEMNFKKMSKGSKDVLLNTK
ncbi:MAG TPA: hypothetical protein EYG97_04780 [Arcobacter sp.]|nr:hypothetical protein [Arcobacter sp.]